MNKGSRKKTVHRILLVLVCWSFVVMMVLVVGLTTRDDLWNSNVVRWNWSLSKDVLSYYRRHETLPPCNLSTILQSNDTRVKVNITAPSLGELNRTVSTTLPGGHYVPPRCIPQHRVAIVIPYRNRRNQLMAFLKHMHPFLQRQMIEYQIFVIELVASITFNRGLLMNIGYVEANSTGTFDCYIFHDVDLFPENHQNVYICNDKNPRHLTVAIDKFHYKLPYGTIMGGACSFTKKQFETINGFSNSYFGWGGEDDDLYQRVNHHGMNISRYSVSVARYTMMKHAQEARSPKRHKLVTTAHKRFGHDGLNSLKYKVLERTDHSLYTFLLVSVNTKDFETNITVDKVKPTNGKGRIGAKQDTVKGNKDIEQVGGKGKNVTKSDEGRETNQDKTKDVIKQDKENKNNKQDKSKDVTKHDKAKNVTREEVAKQDKGQEVTNQDKDKEEVAKQDKGQEVTNQDKDKEEVVKQDKGKEVTNQDKDKEEVSKQDKGKEITNQNKDKEEVAKQDNGKEVTNQDKHKEGVTKQDKGKEVTNQD